MVSHAGVSYCVGYVNPEDIMVACRGLAFEVYDGERLVGMFVNGHGVSYQPDSEFNRVMFSLSDMAFLQSRVMPKQQWCSRLAKWFGLQDWDPVTICRKTHGYKMFESIWIKFPEDPPTLSWEEVQKQIW